MIMDYPNVKTGMMLEIKLTATDPDMNDSLMFDVTGLPAELMWEDVARGEARIYGKVTAAGTYNVDVSVTDDGTPAESDSQTFTITAMDPPPPSDVKAEAEIEAHYKHERKEMRVKGKVTPIEETDDDDDMCSLFEGDEVVITNTDQKMLYTTSVNCKGKFKARFKVANGDLSCNIHVAIGDLMPYTVDVEECRMEDEEEHSDHDSDSDSNDSSMASAGTQSAGSGAVSTAAAPDAELVARVGKLTQRLRRVRSQARRACSAGTDNCRVWRRNLRRIARARKRLLAAMENS